MSLDLINHKLTTSTTDKNGVTTWRNPIVNVSIDSMGRVFKQGKVYEGNFDYSNVQVKYRTTIVDGGNKLYTNVSFNSLFSRMVLGVKLGAKTIYLKDTKAGYTKENVSFVSNRLGTSLKHPIKQLNFIKQQNNTIETQQQTEETMTIRQTNDVTLSNQYYTLYEAKNEHITEDGAVFPTKELAEWHQTKVSKGKGNAQVVLDYNGGFVLAEQIYLQEVIYNKTKPYANFVDVLNNNQGIVSVVQDEHCVFDKLDNEHGLSPVQLNLFGLDKVIKLSCTKVQAEKINTSLNKYSEAFSKLEDGHKTLKDLLKQVS